MGASGTSASDNRFRVVIIDYGAARPHPRIQELAVLAANLTAGSPLLLPSASRCPRQREPGEGATLLAAPRFPAVGDP